MDESTTLMYNLPDGTQLQGGRYSIVRFISNGGFGCTYEAEQQGLGRVAIKEFFPKDYCVRSSNMSVTVGTSVRKGLVEKLKTKFAAEAKMMFQMHHPSIVHVSDIFEENGTIYYVMDYIEGESLMQKLEREGALSESEAVGYVRQVAEALKYVHSKNYLHLDIKPGNIMVDGCGTAILIDFGVSKQYDEVDGENTSTLMGYTPGYAPGEQMTHEVARFLPATDIYALGATLYKLLSGVTPISATARSAGEELLPLPDTISKSVRAAVSNAMNLNKHLRTQSAEEFISSLSSSNQQPKPSEDDVNVNPRTITTRSSAKWMDIKEFLSQKRYCKRGGYLAGFLLLLGLALFLSGVYYSENYYVYPDIPYNLDYSERDDYVREEMWREIDRIKNENLWTTFLIRCGLIDIDGDYMGKHYEIFFRREDVLLAVGAPLVLLSTLFLWLFYSPIVGKIYNIERVDLKRRRVARVMSRSGKLGLCYCGIAKMRKWLNPEYDSIEPCGEEAYICCQNGKYGLYNIARKKMVVPVNYDSLRVVNSDKIEATLDNEVCYFTIKGYRAL